MAPKNLTQEPVAQEPVAQEPVAQEPVAQEPVAQEPVAQEPVALEKDAALAAILGATVSAADASCGAEAFLVFVLTTIAGKKRGKQN